MLWSWRRMVVAIITFALSSQLVPGQMLLCGQMDMSAGGAAVPAMAADHERHPETRGEPASEAGAQMSAPHSPECPLAASCGSVPAALMPSLTAFVPDPAASDLPSPVGAQRLRSLRPELPPPRV